MKTAKILGSVKYERSADDYFLFLIQDYITTTIETTTGVFSVWTDCRLEATDTLECRRVQIGENRFLIVKNAPFEILTLGLFATKCIICF